MHINVSGEQHTKSIRQLLGNISTNPESLEQLNRWGLEIGSAMLVVRICITLSVLLSKTNVQNRTSAIFVNFKPCSTFVCQSHSIYTVSFFKRLNHFYFKMVLPIPVKDPESILTVELETEETGFTKKKINAVVKRVGRKTIRSSDDVLLIFIILNHFFFFVGLLKLVVY